MPDYGQRTGRDTLEIVLRRLDATERELRRLRGGLVTLDRGDTVTQPAPVEGQQLIQYDTDQPWYYANGEWRDYCCPVTSGGPSLAEIILGLTGLDAFWKLNEAAGATAALDSSGNGYSLVLQSGLTLPVFGNTGAGVGPPGEQSALFDYSGTSGGDALGRVTTPASPTNNFTAFGWMRFNNSVGTDLDCLFARANDGLGAQTTGWRVWLDNADYKLRVTINGSTDVVGNSALSPLTWYMWAVKRDAGTWSLYVNGVEQTAHSTTAPTASTNIRLGSFGPFTGRGWEGNQSYVALLSRALTAAEILDLYTAAGTTSYPAGYVLTADGTGTTTWEKATIEVTY